METRQIQHSLRAGTHHPSLGIQGKGGVGRELPEVTQSISSRAKNFTGELQFLALSLYHKIKKPLKQPLLHMACILRSIFNQQQAIQAWIQATLLGGLTATFPVSGFSKSPGYPGIRYLCLQWKLGLNSSESIAAPYTEGQFSLGHLICHNLSPRNSCKFSFLLLNFDVVRPIISHRSFVSTFFPQANTRLRFGSRGHSNISIRYYTTSSKFKNSLSLFSHQLHGLQKLLSSETDFSKSERGHRKWQLETLPSQSLLCRPPSVSRNSSQQVASAALLCCPGTVASQCLCCMLKSYWVACLKTFIFQS